MLIVYFEDQTQKPSITEKNDKFLSIGFGETRRSGLDMMISELSQPVVDDFNAQAANIDTGWFVVNKGTYRLYSSNAFTPFIKATKKNTFRISFINKIIPNGYTLLHVDTLGHIERYMTYTVTSDTESHDGINLVMTVDNKNMTAVNFIFADNENRVYKSTLFLSTYPNSPSDNIIRCSDLTLLDSDDGAFETYWSDYDRGDIIPVYKPRRPTNNFISDGEGVVNTTEIARRFFMDKKRLNVLFINHSVSDDIEPLTMEGAIETFKNMKVRAITILLDQPIRNYTYDGLVNKYAPLLDHFNIVNFMDSNYRITYIEDFAIDGYTRQE